MIFNFHAVVAIAFAFQLLLAECRTFAPCRSVYVFLPVRTSLAIFVGRLVGVVSWLSFCHKFVQFVQFFQSAVALVKAASRLRVQKQEEHPHRMPLAGLIFGRIACGRALSLFCVFFYLVKQFHLLGSCQIAIKNSSACSVC